MTERLKDLPSTLPERGRVRADATIVFRSAALDRKNADAGVDGEAERGPSLPLDSYQPGPVAPTGPSTSPPLATSDREVVVPSRATVSSILEEVRKPACERLEVEARLASGGMGSIDVVVDRALDRRIAVKTLHRHLRGEDAAVRMFLREARLTGLLDHPHIVPVYELGERPDDASLYFAMKLVQGQTLAALAEALPRSRDIAMLYMLLDVVAKVCDALAFAHSRGVLHCDVKPANVMVGEFGQVFLMDWGIARLITTPSDAPKSAADQTIIGTPCYMSPEQARGDRQKLDARSDVFLLGATLYELLTHRPPYLSRDRMETLALAAAAAFPSARSVAGQVAVPLELDRIVTRAMARAPEDRYPTVAALKDDLVRFMRGGAEFPRRSIAAGEHIIREGESGDAAYILVDGRCEVRKGGQSLKTIGPSDVFGEMAILTEGPRTASVVAIEPTTVLVVTSQVLEQEMAALKPWMARLLKSLATRFRDLDTLNRVTSPTFPTPARVANQVLMTLTTWGEAHADGSLSMTWTAVSAELESQLSIVPVALFSAISRYGILLDMEGDLLTIPQPAELRARLKADLTLE